MRKIIIILIITLTTFMGGNIYTNNTGNLSENNTIISEDYPIINENFNDNFQKLEENIEDKNQLEVSNDKENEEIVPEENNVTVTLPITLDNATEEKREEKKRKE